MRLAPGWGPCDCRVVVVSSVSSEGAPLWPFRKAGEGVKQRIIKNLGTTSTEQGDNNESDVEIIKGVKTQYYN